MKNFVQTLGQFNPSHPPPRVAFHTLGCRLNAAETGSLMQGFIERGHQVVEFGQSADVIFINTCTVTDAADSTCRHMIRKAHRSSPEARIVVAGCYAQMDADRIARMKGVDLVLGTSEKFKVFDYLDEEARQTVATDKTWHFYKAATAAGQGRTRAFLKIQDGCNYVCSFCIIPQARGRSRALSVAECVWEARRLIASGFREIVLTGVNIGEYHHSSGATLSSLVGELLNLDGLARLRLSSVEPNVLSDELLEVLASSPKSAHHFHVPLQSGSNSVLSDMRRKYTVEDYRRVIARVLNSFPGAAIGADIIAGFPGEDERQFEETCQLVSELPITHFHVFPYSKRKHTVAARRDDHIPHTVRKARAKTLIQLGEDKLAQYCHRQVGTVHQVLFEHQNEQGLWVGHTSHFLKTAVASPQNLKNQMCRVRITGSLGGRLQGKLIA